jgi:hypothetical protein
MSVNKFLFPCIPPPSHLSPLSFSTYLIKVFFRLFWIIQTWLEAKMKQMPCYNIELIFYILAFYIPKYLLLIHHHHYFLDLLISIYFLLFFFFHLCIKFKYTNVPGPTQTRTFGCFELSNAFSTA